jgi:hypothetical protein
MKSSTIFISTILLAFSFASCNFSSDSVFSDETYQDTIKQNIGGSLIRDIHYYNDFQSYIYDIKYSYKNQIDSIKIIGYGSYYSQEPPKDEQLVQIDKWKIFKTSKDRDVDMLFVCDNFTKNWTEYEISPETIEQSDLWKKQNIESRTDNWDSVAKVKKIDSNGEVTVIYTYVRKKWIPFFKTGKRKVIYKIDFKTGRLEISKILEL